MHCVLDISFNLFYYLNPMTQMLLSWFAHLSSFLLDSCICREEGFLTLIPSRLGTLSQQNWKNMGQKSFLFQSLFFCHGMLIFLPVGTVSYKQDNFAKVIWEIDKLSLKYKLSLLLLKCSYFAYSMSMPIYPSFIASYLSFICISIQIKDWPGKKVTIL